MMLKNYDEYQKLFYGKSQNIIFINQSKCIDHLSEKSQRFYRNRKKKKFPFFSTPIFLRGLSARKVKGKRYIVVISNYYLSPGLLLYYIGNIGFQASAKVNEKVLRINSVF